MLMVQTSPLSLPINLPSGPVQFYTSLDSTATSLLLERSPLLMATLQLNLLFKQNQPVNPPKTQLQLHSQLQAITSCTYLTLHM